MLWWQVALIAAGLGLWFVAAVGLAVEKVKGARARRRYVRADAIEAEARSLAAAGVSDHEVCAALAAMRQPSLGDGQ